MPEIYFRAIRGRKGHPNWVGIAKEMRQTAERETIPMLEGYHKRIVAQWSGDKPGFKGYIYVSKLGLSIRVRTTGSQHARNKWRRLIEGTGLHGPKHRAYPIYPKKPGGVLVFPSKYRPRTKPGAGGQYKGPGKGYGPIVFTKKVDKPGVTHPGMKPRPFPKVIARWARPKFTKQMENACRRGARRA